jgi:Carboxypeptidase regulatory-like domain
MSKCSAWALAGLVAVMIGLGSSPALAQFSSAIEGTVVDQSSAVVPGATVTITNEANGVTQTGTSTTAGYYRFPALPSGSYTLRASLSGFKTAVREHIRVEVAETETVNVTLDVGKTEEEVLVRANAQLVETSQGRVSGLIQESQVEDLPLVGRNFFNLVVLTPGVTGRASGGGQSYAQSNADIFINEYGVNMNANGARTESNNFLVDSSTISSSQRSGVANVTPNPEVVEEVRIAVNNFSAEQGRNGSVLVDIVTKSGSNNWHGSGSWFFSNNSMQGKNNFQEQTPGFQIPDFTRNEYAWGFGGPVKRDHTFFFTSGDVLRSDVAISRAARIVTPEFIRFMEQARPSNVSTYIMSTFPASFGAERNFLTAGQLLGAACSGSEAINSSVGPIPCNLPVTGEGTFNTTSPRDGLQWTARVDQYLGAGDRIYGSFNRTSVNKVLFGTPDVYPDFNTISPTNSMQFNTNWTKIISPTLVNEAAFAWVRVYGNLPLNRPDVPGVQVTGIERYQTTWGPNDFVQNNFEWRDVVTWTRGAHTMKAGANFSRGHADNEGSRVFNRPIYSFNSVFDFAADNPSIQDNLAIDPDTGAAVTDLLRLHRTTGLGAFIQEDWKVRPNFTLNLGFRFESFLNIHDAAGDVTAIVFSQQTGDLENDLRTATLVEREYMLDGGLWSGGQYTFAPRVSFAWDPTSQGRWSIRGGYGRFYERMSNQLWDSEYTNLPGFAVTLARSSDPVKPVFGLGTTAEKPFNYPRPSGLTAGLNPQGGLINGRAKADVLDPDIGDMSLDNWFLGVQRGLGRYVSVEADYIGSRGNDMYVRYNVNRFDGDLLDGQFNGLMPGVSSLLYGRALDSSHYHGGTLALRVNRTGLQGGAAYTFGKAIDFSSTLSPPARPDANGPPEQDEGPADSDVRQKLAMWGNWMIPGPSGGAAGAILGGWQLTGMLIAQTGTPFSVVCNGSSFVPIRDASGNIVGNSGCDYNADGTQSDRPNIPAFGSSLSGLSNDDFLAGIFKASDFPTPAPGQNGTLGRNTYRGPRYFNIDLALIKNIKVPWMTGAGADAQFRLEAFNAFNITNLDNPVNELKNPLFGRSVSAQNGRVLQIALRLQF